MRRLGVLLLLALLVGGPAADARHRATDTIVFTTFRDTAGAPTPYYNLYAMNAGGSAPTRLTTVAKQDWNPALSPDGMRIAFERDQAAFDLWVMNADGSGQVNLTPGPGSESHAAWSPDGSKIAFRSNRDQDGDGAPDDFEVFVMNADGTGATQLTFNAANEQSPSFSPDGTQITFASNVDGDYDIYVVPAGGGSPTPLTDDPDADAGPEWSPDGTKIAFTSYRDDPLGEIYVMDADGSDETALTTSAAEDFGPTWSPDGSALAWVKDLDVWVMDADGSDQVALTSTGNNSDPSWGPRRPRLTIGKAGLGSGTVTAPGIACGTDCTELYGYEAAVTLDAAAAPGSRFIRWGGACSGNVTTCVVTMELTKLVTAEFARVVAGKVCTHVGTPGRDTVLGTAGPDVICTLGGNDTARGAGGNDWIFLGAGKDRGYGGPGRDRIHGERGNDLLVGGPQRDRLLGGPGRDTCRGRGDVKRSC